MGMTTKGHIEVVINNINTAIFVSSVDVLGGDLYKLYSKNTKWATIGKTLGGYVIKEVIQDTYVVVSSAVVLSLGNYNLELPFFYYGTFLDTNFELLKTKSSNDKLPCIYLHLNAPESYQDEFAMVDFESDCAIYFMVDANPSNWLTGDHYLNAIKPMKALVKSFVIALSNYAKVNNSSSLTFVQNDYVNFGKVMSDKGIEKQIFKDNMSGVELLIKIAWNKCVICCN